jgi:hypothetical protein
MVSLTLSHPRFEFCDIQRLLTALLSVETGGHKEPELALGESGELGPYQITEAFYLDAKAELELRWDVEVPPFQVACTSYHWSAALIAGYWLRYTDNIPSLEELARLFHGGPEWSSKEHTKAYWHKVMEHLYAFDPQICLFDMEVSS